MLTEKYKFARELVLGLEELVKEYPDEQRLLHLLKVARGEMIKERLPDDLQFVRHIEAVLKQPWLYTHTVVTAYEIEKPLEDYGHGYREDEYIMIDEKKVDRDDPTQ